MKITETLLLDNYDGKTNGGDNCSNINGETIYWTYRTGPTSDGYNCVCSRSNAGEITLEYTRHGTIELDDLDYHPAIKKIHSDEQKMWGNEI